MLLPSLACQAHCGYCFGPNHGPIMPLDVFDAAVEWIDTLTKTAQTVEITFHGGEPLLAGLDWYRQALPILQQRFTGRLKLGIQSNLWLLDDDFCALYKEYAVSIGTSLDGPEAINDSQRGKGCFRQTMAGIETARRNGLNPGVICTFTQLSAPHYREVFEFFANEGLAFSIHQAVDTLGGDVENGFTLHPDEAARLMRNLFETYLDNLPRTKISNFDAMARGLFNGNGTICTFSDCLGKYLAVGPEGGIYPCNRFAYHPEWQIGSVIELPDEEKLALTPVWQKLRRREQTVLEDCGDCTHFEYCKGGCPYNAFAAGTDRRDPNCRVYRELYDLITEQALQEVFSEENLEVVVQQGSGKAGLMQKGRLIGIMNKEPHPYAAAGRAREAAASVALACSSSVEEAVDRLDRAGIITRREVALGSLRALRQRLDQRPLQGMVNAYLHVTYSCNLSCTHCYARGGPEKSAAMGVEEIRRLVRQTAAAGFRKIVITGGEPVLHPRRDELLAALAGLRRDIKPAQLVLRTNLAYPLTPALAGRMAETFDQIVVSVDGDEAFHDTRRGVGTYARTVQNLGELLEVQPVPEIQLMAVLSAQQIEGLQGESVLALGERLQVGVRFKPVLPIGRGRELDLTLEPYNSLDKDSEILAAGSQPTSTCGLGKNLNIGSEGECYPCYALMGKEHRLGNVFKDGLDQVLARNDSYRQVTVDSTEKCRTCALRYLCGGFCRAWGITSDPYSAPVDCLALQKRAGKKLSGAMEILGISRVQWQGAGLPLPVDLVPDLNPTDKGR
ncbi:MAG: TIGR04083 family peptide-modifying radical SAM enzyme [Anaerolineales bacterium]|nr:TIGR04083 family peptide-modifying radical SAM enzyme [Anaerolineales bacterium]